VTEKIIPTRTTRAVIDLSACRHNLQQAKLAAPDSRLIAVIKANAYGHGMLNIAHALNETDMFAVARVEEAVMLRESGIKKPILLLEGFTSEAELILVSRYDLDCVVHHESQIQILEKSNSKTSNEIKINAWLKIDTGMHRLGFVIEEVESTYKRLSLLNKFKQPLQIMTHLANADDKNDQTTLNQIDIFNQKIETIKKINSDPNTIEFSIANSAGILGWPLSHSNWNRPGILLYGVSPFINELADEHNLKPVMTLKSQIISIKKLNKGEPVGYAGEYICEKNMRIGIVAIGYGDGYPRHAKTGTPVLINNKRSQLLGRVSMDMICVDLTDLNDTKIYDSVTLWGKGLPVEEVAAHAGTIAYDLLCGVTKRVEFIYTEK